MLTAAAAAQSLQIPAPPQDRPVAIVNATIHPISAPTIPRGYILFERGLITDIGPGDFHSHAGVELFDADGLHVYPGLISTDSILGLAEITSIRATVDTTETGSITPEVRAIVAVNPDSAIIPVTRANGILTALTTPSGGVVSGYGSIIRLDGWTTEEMSIDDRAGLVVRWPDVTPSTSPWATQSTDEQLRRIRERLDEIDAAFHEALAYHRARNADSNFPIDVRLEAFSPVLDRSRPLFIHATDAPRIRSAVAWANRMNLRVVIVGGLEADQCADLLVEHDIPVIITGTHRLPGRRDLPHDDPFALPVRLHDAGVRFAIAGNDRAANERNMPYHAAKSIAYGLPYDVGLRSITLAAAEILGIGRTHGSLEVGKVATLIVTTGDPLEIMTDVVDAFIDGSRIDLDSKHKMLNRKYRERYGQ